MKTYKHTQIKNRVRGGVLILQAQWQKCAVIIFNFRSHITECVVISQKKSARYHTIYIACVSRRWLYYGMYIYGICALKKVLGGLICRQMGMKMIIGEFSQLLRQTCYLHDRHVLMIMKRLGHIHLHKSDISPFSATVQCVSSFSLSGRQLLYSCVYSTSIW